MNLLSYIHPVRTFLPCSGVGRHMNGVLGGLSSRDEIDLELIFSRQWLNAEGRLPENCPLRELPFRSFRMNENLLERSWKLFGFPTISEFNSKHVDWIYCPMETRLPSRVRLPFAFTLHDVQAFESDLPWSQTRSHRVFRKKWAAWVGKAIQEASVVFTVSEFSRQRILKLVGAPEEKIQVSGNAVDAHWFTADDKSGFRKESSEDPYVCMIGGLRHKKGGVHYLALARELASRKSPTRIVIAGPNDPDLEKAAEELPNLRLAGFLEDSELPALVGNSLAMVFLSEYEGFGIPPLEAMAMGVPAIVSNRASLPEVVGNAGVVVEPDQSTGIADRLEAWLQYPDQRNAQGAVGKVHASTFTWSAVADRVYHALRSGS